jgi:DNA-binding NtrC family response regulator
MVYGIVKQSGGDIRVYSEPRLGTTFKIYLPRLTEGTETEAASEPLLLRSGQGCETVLVLEDDNSLRTLIRQVLIRKGYEVLDTGDADEAIRICDLHDGEIALLITDVILPKMSGPQVAGQALELRPDIKVLYTSGYTANALLHHGVRQQQPTFVEKPFTPDALARKVREVLDTPPIAPEVPE